jgi:CO/xanthine dehydrogenase Mo-binding subunit
MKEIQIVNENRRNFLKFEITAGTGLTLGIYLPSLVAQWVMAEPGKAADGIISDAPFMPNAFVRIDAENRVTVIVKHIEFGQGTFTGLPTLVAEELDANGKLIAWQHRIVGQSIITGTVFESALVKEGIDTTSVEGAVDLPYRIPNMTVKLHSPKMDVPVQWWRSVGHTHTAFSTETFIDELAFASGKDPLVFRRELLSDHHRRHRGVMELAAKKAAWDSTLPKGRGRGIAVHKSFNSYVAEVAEVTL